MAKKAPAALLLLALAASPALSEGSWETMEYVNPYKHPNDNRAIAETWKSQVSGDASWGLAYRTYRVGNGTMTLMVGLQKSCDSPNNPVTNQIYSTCPLYVVTQRDGQTTTQAFQGACYNDDHTDIDKVRAGKDNYIQTQYDPAAHALTVRTVQYGKVVPECTKTLQVN